LRLVKNNNETKLRCLLRHTRNALAHGNFYYKPLPNDKKIFLTDFDSKNKLTAIIITNAASMLRWKKLLEEIAGDSDKRMNT